ncbi:hypothetical protein CYMTET_38038 [Cymbomonas tetramitiformis]|uniref:Centriolar and ciliogenesis-associated protein HYLS1 C-terminal domain-containing protein n=1 Tax=Cymbomonas tetramitiformis TaxID=36881 RepID=A0AAE0CEW4_9CHLO|nr:hypothetical protein CYMTET_38038 [Cymbomonas tetramitiformis]
MSAYDYGITVDQVREQLSVLGHNDVPDRVIGAFLKDIQVERGMMASGVQGSNIAHSVPEIRETAPLSSGNVLSKECGSDENGGVTAACDTTQHGQVNGNSMAKRDVYSASYENMRRCNERYAAQKPQHSEEYRGYDEYSGSDEEASFVEQTYADHGYNLEHSSRAHPELPQEVRQQAVIPKPRRVRSPPQGDHLKENRPLESAKSVPTLNLNRGSAASPRPRVSDAWKVREPLTSRSGSLTSRSSASALNAGSIGSIVTNPERKSAKVDRVARYAAMQKTWKNDSFLSGKTRPRQSNNFHKIYAAQHANHAQETALARKRSQANKKTPSTYVPPQDKRRDALRWETRVRLINDSPK